MAISLNNGLKKTLDAPSLVGKLIGESETGSPRDVDGHAANRDVRRTLPSRDLISVLRAIVCLSIVGFHSYPIGLWEWPFENSLLPSPRWMVENLRPGFSSFFVLAGYFLAHSFRPADSYLSIPGYIKRRVLRLVIPYWVALAFALAANLLADWYRGRDLLAVYLESWPSLFFVQNILDRRAGVPAPLWFMAPLMQFVFLWTAAFWTIRFIHLRRGSENPHAQAMSFMRLATAVVFLGSIVVAIRDPELRWKLPVNAHYLSVGCAIYWASMGEISRRWMVAGLAVEVVLGLVNHDTRPVTAAIVGWLLSVCASWRVPENMVFRILAQLGAMSFSIYLTHGIVGPRVYNIVAGPPTVAAPPFASFVGMMAAIAASLLVGAFFYWIIERPVAHWSTRVGYRA